MTQRPRLSVVDAFPCDLYSISTLLVQLASSWSVALVTLSIGQIRSVVFD
ncbi:hypothetical protein TRICHSKD4_2900 [Roseibium sp. TrichSKD4]|nr:hypothetical protein TRICHSKD4_2900 [Roseibium sp. TrichSKD4]